MEIQFNELKNRSALIEKLKEDLYKKEKELESIVRYIGYHISWWMDHGMYYTNRPRIYWWGQEDFDVVPIGNSYMMGVDPYWDYYLVLSMIENDPPMVLDFRLEKIVDWWMNMYILWVDKVSESYSYDNLDYLIDNTDEIELWLEDINMRITKMINWQIDEVQKEIDFIKQQLNW